MLKTIFFNKLLSLDCLNNCYFSWDGEIWRDEYLKWICGFANAQGGKIYIGTNDDGTVPVNYRGEYHYRSGSTKQLLKGQALNQFLLKKTGITWDSVPIQDVAVRDLRNDSFDIFREQAVLSKRMDKKDVDSSNEQLLDSLNLLDHGMLKRAAILLLNIICGKCVCLG